MRMIKTALCMSLFASMLMTPLLSFADNTTASISMTQLDKGELVGSVVTDKNSSPVIYQGPPAPVMTFPTSVQPQSKLPFHLNVEMLSDAYSPISYLAQNDQSKGCLFVFAFYDGTVNVKANAQNGASCSVSVTSKSKLLLNISV